MFLSPRNEPPEDVQELIDSRTSPNCSPSAAAAPSDMESGGGGATSRTSTSDHVRVHGEQEAGAANFWSKNFSLSFLLLVGVTASLVILPLVLPPLPPPPSMLMLVPAAMLVLLLVLAFMPASGGRGGTAPTYL